ncbi:MAG: hypothetical protein JNL87_17450 [Burkholderiaceae bacterium]|nr:hypothetical protein [Burkholderiaceae bacterium]
MDDRLDRHAPAAALSDLPRLGASGLVDQVVASLRRSEPRAHYHVARPTLVPVEPAAYTLVVGAGFSAGVVPMVRELMQQTIGGYYFVGDMEGTASDRSPSWLRRRSGEFWREFNAAAHRLHGCDAVALRSRDGQPLDCAAAYRTLFQFDIATEMFRTRPEDRPQRRRPRHGSLRAAVDGGDSPGADAELGRDFVQGFLEYIVAPGIEHGSGFTGRTKLNPAHRELARLLEAQQDGRAFRCRPFCRNIFTTNFDTLLQVALQQVGIVPCVTDRPERGIDTTLFEREAAIHLVYTHGSILRRNPASTARELAGLADANLAALAQVLGERDAIVVGHSGWHDSLTRALAACGPGRHHLWWCDTRPEPNVDVLRLHAERGGAMTYVALGDAGADGLMRALSDALLGPTLAGTVKAPASRSPA